MTQIVDAAVEDERWQGVEIEAIAERAAVATLTYLGVSTDFEISLLACDDERIAVLNQEFRAKGQPTNVLSWPSEERGAEVEGAVPAPPEPDPQAASFGEPSELGDIAISYDTCAREAESEGKPFVNHVMHLMVHGVLHLLGYDHIREKDALLMEKLEREILETLSIPDPYKTTG
ncbi:rRNA maturation RNase YbeY [Falsihalocynthiibacter sp. SS001]|uniref:rRNA maturation RNase YbeY n=1 Tax=Falsihalocynthiibacter sp. SS001 TaxID=3349698 RepID=UPI0036D3659F